MRRFQLAPLILLLVACGGSAARNTPKTLPSVAGAAGEPGSAAGTSNTAAGEGGVAGTSVGGAGGVAAVAGADAGDAGAEGGGQPSSQGCVGLDCLAGAELIYVPDRAWQNPGGADGAHELAEADYQPLLGPTWRAKFSSDALAVDMTPTAGGDTVHGTRDPQRADRAWFELMLFSGGRFVVKASSSALQAEYTTYGSGVPIIASTRGLLTNP